MKRSMIAFFLLGLFLTGCSSVSSRSAVVRQEVLSPAWSAKAEPAIHEDPPASPSAYIELEIVPSIEPIQIETPPPTFDIYSIPLFSGTPTVEVNGNIPYFTETERTTEAFETYSDLDDLERCGVAYANLCTELMPTEPRGNIGMVKPSGWHTVRYNDIVEGNYLYNRCHLIGYQLAGENENEKNLITGTRFLNTIGMLPYENQVASYLQSTGNHVLYRVTPIFVGDDLLASGVLMEGLSVEDDGAGICFCVYAYNEQPYIEIDHATGESQLAPDAPIPTPEPTQTPAPSPKPTEKPTVKPEQNTKAVDYIGNKNTKKFHYPYCSSVGQMKESNKYYYSGSREDMIQKGYVPCKKCSP